MSNPTVPSFADLQHIWIKGLDVAVCPLEMPHPVRLGPIVYSTRDYIVLRLRTDADIEGYAIGYTRDTPVLQALQTLAPEILGRDARMLRSIVIGLNEAHGHAWGAFVRAASLVDVALWDIAAKAAGLPLYKLVGAYRDSVPVMAVAGYYPDRRSVEEIQEEVVLRAHEGFRIIKVGLPALDPRADEAYISRLRQALDSRIDLGVDAHTAWTDLAAALAACERLDPLGLAFIEDPCSAESWRLMIELQKRIRTPLAAADEVTTIEQYRHLLGAVTILRVDATVCGGFTNAMMATQLAAAAGRSVIPHVYANLHSHLAAALPSVQLVEVIPAEVGADPINRLLRSEPVIKDGVLLMDSRPGNGIDLDWEAVSGNSSVMLTRPEKS
jgi:L-alanine-DL-glutamate epimerase-like enolase superfamily enzyme